MDNSSLINFKLCPRLCPLEQASSHQACGGGGGPPRRQTGCPWHAPSADSCPDFAGEETGGPSPQGKFVLSRLPASAAACGQMHAVTHQKVLIQVSVAYWVLERFYTQTQGAGSRAAEHWENVRGADAPPADPRREERAGRYPTHILSRLPLPPLRLPR